LAGGSHGGGFVEGGGLGVGGELDDLGDAGRVQGGQLVGAEAAAGVGAFVGGVEALEHRRRLGAGLAGSGDGRRRRYGQRQQGREDGRGAARAAAAGVRHGQAL